MSIDTQSCPRTDITVAGVILSVPQPFTEGHVLRANEAAVLNQTYAENLRNNFAGTVKKAKEGEAEPDTAALQAALDEYINTYDFGVRRVGTRTVPLDPVHREALRLAGEAVKAALHKKGMSIKEIGKERFDELANQLLSDRPELMERAKQIIEIKSSISGGDVEV